ncbi:hypothetical protein AnigIFM49718_011659 [Aspergillus niger]|nr:hypothetical protein AnigIFM49718_011659 [Aspergillus niger]
MHLPLPSLLLLLSSLLLTTTTTTTTTLIPSPGDRTTISTWHIQPTNTNTNTTPNPLNLTTTTSHSTIFAALLLPQNQPNPILPYNESTLFHSTTLSIIPTTPFQSPWLYTTSLTLSLPLSHEQILLTTHGISSRGDIFINGHQIASISGAYNGQKYDISSQVKDGENEVVVRVYPVDYMRDFGVGWADWNPPPPDNGMGIWRGVEVRRVNGVGMGRVRVVVVGDVDVNGEGDVKVKVKVDVRNWRDEGVRGAVMGRIFHDDTNNKEVEFAQLVTLRGGETTTVEAAVTIPNAKIWWPATWGRQDMYTVLANFTLNNGKLSDRAECSFGIRSVTATLTEHGDEKDISFKVNGYPFHVRGAGYSPDIFLRFDIDRVRTLFQAVLDMGLNTIRLEGKLEHPQFYDLADRMGVMVLAGWECCDKWEAWEYNTNLERHYPWTTNDYLTASSSLTHESLTLQPHPSILAFLLGSDYPPQHPRQHPLHHRPEPLRLDQPHHLLRLLPNPPIGNENARPLGAAFGFGSEQGAGVGTPELPSLRRFLSPQELDTLWKEKDAGMYHMSPSGSQFHTRGVYNAALWGRYV